jgi:hypothetical protein
VTRERNRRERREFLEHLRADLRVAHAGALLIAPRLLRRVTKATSTARHTGLHVPHGSCCALRRDVLLRIVGARELKVPADSLPEQVYLIAEPDRTALQSRTSEELRRQYWRLLFHAMVHGVLQLRRQSGELNLRYVQEQILLIGQAQFDEIRAMLQHEDLLVEPDDEVATYCELVALYLEFCMFDPGQLPLSFSDDFLESDADRLIRSEVDVETTFRLSRSPACRDLTPDAPAYVAQVVAPNSMPAVPSSALAASYESRAKRHYQKRSLARAAILYATAARCSSKRSSERAAQATSILRELCTRFLRATKQDEARVEEVYNALFPLLRLCEKQRFNVEAKLLADLEKVCLAAEEKVHTLGPVAWFFSRGEQDLIRELPRHRQVQHLRRLDAACGRLGDVRLAKEEKAALEEVLGGIQHVCRERLRSSLREELRDTLAEVGLIPANLPERIAAAKLVEELLDRIVTRGFINIGDLRDVLAQNALKLPDIDSLGRFIRGDRLLAADRLLARRLEGVYRRGEIYMRLLQRLSSLAFGTWLGRLLTLFVILPFGGAFVVLEGLEHSVMLLVNHLSSHAMTVVSGATITALGCVIGTLIHIEPSRRGLIRALRLVARGLRRIVLDFPKSLLALPWVVSIRQQHWFSLTLRYLIKPLLLSALVSSFFPLVWPDVSTNIVAALMAFLLVNTLLNSRAGRTVEELLAEALSRTWRNLRYRVVPGALELVMSLFNTLLERMERAIYTVDERLRLESGDGAIAFLFKLMGGLFWSVCTYVFRVYINLLVEPQVNPIKHFPVVTVSHKIILPLSGVLLEAFSRPLVPVFGEFIGTSVAAATVFLLPGVFGFLVWEFKSNWRLYDANRTPTLRPEVVGDHSETLLRFMKPGFHSGTLPKLYGKLRKAKNKDRERRLSRVFKDLQGVRRALIRFAERSLIAYLEESARVQLIPIDTMRESPPSYAVGDVILSMKRITFHIVALGHEDNPIELVFEEKSGWLVVGMVSMGWVEELSEGERALVVGALTGFYAWAGVELVREHVEETHALDQPYDIRGGHLVKWGLDRAVVPTTELASTSMAAAPTQLPSASGQTLNMDPDVFFSKSTVRWRRWVNFWNEPATSKPLTSHTLLQP